MSAVLGNLVTIKYIAGATNPISDEDWKSYAPDFDYTKNSTRAVVFGGDGFLSSPGYPTGTFVYYTDTKGYTWLWNEQNRMAIYPFDQSLYPGMTIFQGYVCHGQTVLYNFTL